MRLCRVLVIATALGATLANPFINAPDIRAQTARDTARAWRIVAAVPLSGHYAPTGQAMVDRLAQTAAELNAAGGINGRRVEVKAIDDACSKEGGMTAATKADELAATVVIGHPCASAAQAALAGHVKAGRLVLLAGLRQSGMPPLETTPLVFRFSGRNDRLGSDTGHRLARLARSGSAEPGARVAIVHDRTIMAKSVAAAAKTAAIADGATIAHEIGIVASEASYAKAITAVIAAKPSAILFSGYPAEGAIVLRELRAAGGTIPFLAIDTHAGPEFVADAQALLSGDVEVMLPSPSAGPDDAPRSYSDIAAADADSAIRAWAASVRITGTDTPTAIAHQFMHGSPSQFGVAFDAEHGVLAPAFRPYRWRDGGWRLAAE